MKHLRAFFISFLLTSTFSVYAQEEVRFETQVIEVRHGEKRGLVLSETAPFQFAQIVPTTLETRGTQIFDQGGVKISINDLQPGTVVEVVGTPQGTILLAREIRVLRKVESFSFGGVIDEIEPMENGQMRLYFAREGPDGVNSTTPVFLDGEELGRGPEPIITILEQTDEPVAISLSNHRHNGWSRIDLEIGRVLPAILSGNDIVTYNLLADPKEAILVDSQDWFHIRKPRPSLVVDTQAQVYDGPNEREVSPSELTRFMQVHTDFQMSGFEVLNLNIRINERPQPHTVTIEVANFDTYREVLLFHNPAVQLSPNTRFLDLSGNTINSRQFEESQWQGQSPLIAIVTIDPINGLGTEARLAFSGTAPGPDEIVLGEVSGLHRGFWVQFHPGNNEMGTHGFEGALLSDTVIQTADGGPASKALLNRGVEIRAYGLGVSGHFLITEIVVLSQFDPFDITARIRFIDRQERRIEFEESPPLQVDQNAEVFDHFGDIASLGFLADFLQQVELQLRLTLGGQGPDGSPAISRIEAFRPGVEVEIGPDQQLIEGGHIDPYSYPPLIFPQSIRSVNFTEETDFLDASGNSLTSDELPDRVRIRAVGQSVANKDPYGEKRRYLVERIEILGGAATEFRGTVNAVIGTTINFRDPGAFFVAGHSDIREETDFNIDFLTLAARIRSEGGLRLWVGVDFNAPGAPQIYWIRVMRADEPTPSHLGSNELIAFFIDADESAQTLSAATTPSIELSGNTQITGRGGESYSPDALVAGAKLRVLAENRSGILTAAEIQVEEIPKIFDLTLTVGFVDPYSRIIHFETPNFVTIATTAQILDQEGLEIDVATLRNRLFQLRFPILRITESLDSPPDAPIADLVEIITGHIIPELAGNQFLAPIDDPSYQIREGDRRIEPNPFPPADISPDAIVQSPSGQPIDLSAIGSGSRVRMKGQLQQGHLFVSELTVVGGEAFTGDAVLAEIDFTNRLIIPESDPPLIIAKRAFITDTYDNRIDLPELAKQLANHPDLIVMVEFNPFGPGVSAIRLADPEFSRPPNPDEVSFEGDFTQVDLENRTLVFSPSPPGRVDENARIMSASGETLSLSDLRAGQRVFLRGEALDEQIIVTSITVIPQVDDLLLVPKIGDFDEGGVDNDVQVSIKSADGSELSLPVQLFLDFNPPVDSRSGHIFTNLTPGPHVVQIEVPILDLFARERVFISARGSAFRVVSTSPAPNTTGVSQSSDITVTFNEEVRRVGDFVSVSGSLKPPPASGDIRKLYSLSEDEKTLIFKGVQLSVNTDYTFTISSATSKSGNILGQPHIIQFSTGSVLAHLGSISGQINVSGSDQFVGTVFLFDSAGEQVFSVPLEDDGSFTMGAVFSDKYRISVDVQAPDGRSTSGFFDKDNDGIPDNIELVDGEMMITDVNIGLVLPEPAQVVTGGGENKSATISLDLDARKDNQSLDSLKIPPDAEVSVAIYADNVSDLIAYSISLNYDTTSVAFQGVDGNTAFEGNLLKQNGGLAVTVPPSVNAGNIEFSGAILGPTEEQTVEGSGLLGVFNFRTRRDFKTQTEFQVPRVLLQSQSQPDTISALARATLSLATTRIFLGLSADPDTLEAGGTTTLKAILNDITGNPVTQQTPVRFGVLSGDAAWSLSSSDVSTETGVAETQLSIYTAGTVVIEVSAGGTTESISIVATEPTLSDGSGVTDSAELPSGDRGPVALDLDPATGDQNKVQTSSQPSGGNTVTVDIVITERGLGLSGFSAQLAFDPAQVSYENFSVQDIFSGGMVIENKGDLASGKIGLNVAFFGATSTAQETGSAGQAVFKILDDFTGPTRITLSSASLAPMGGEVFEPEIGSGGSYVVLGGSTAIPTDPVARADIDGDGTVGFSDFISFAGAFGQSSTDDNFNVRIDFDGDGNIGFGDFIFFAQNFGKTVGS